MKKACILLAGVLITIALNITNLWAGEVVGRLGAQVPDGGNDSLNIELLLQMGDHFEHTDFDSAMLFYRQAFDKAEIALEKSFRELEKETFRLLKLKTLRYIAFLQKSWGRYDDALQSYEQIMAEVSRDTHPGVHVQAHTSIGNIYFYQSLYPQAIRYYNLALQMAEETGNPTLISNILLNLANTYFMIGHYVKSLTFYHQVQQLYPNLTENKNIGIIYLGIGNIQSALGNFDAALEHYELAVKVYDELSDHSSLANIYMSIGSLYFEAKRQEEAELYYKKALAHATTADDNRLRSQLMLNLGILAAQKQDFDTAFELYNKALELAKSSANLHAQTFILRNMAVAYFRLNQPQRALAFARESLEIAQEIESVGDQAHAYKVLSEIREQQGNMAEALKYLKLHKTFNDSLMNIDKQRQLNEMEAIYQTEQQQQLIEIANLELERNRARLQQKNQVITAVIIIFFLLVAVGVVVLRHNNHRIKSNRILRRQEAQIAEGQKTIDKLLRNLKENDLSTVELQNKLAEIKLNLLRYKDFSESIARRLFPWEERFQAAFGETGFLLAQPDHFSQNALVWIQPHNNETLMVVADCQFDVLSQNLFKILLGSALERYTQKEGIFHPSQIMEKLRSEIFPLIRKYSSSGSTLCVSALSINKEERKIRFCGERIPLYIAIARNLAPIGVQTLPEYHELQMLKTHSTDKLKDFHELQLKKSDRLYLLLDGDPCYEQEEGKSNQHIAVPLIDKNQHVAIDALPELLRKKLKACKSDSKLATHPITVAAIEL